MTAPQSVKIVFEGSRAEAATRDLFSKGWFEAEWERPAAPGLAVSAQVHAIAGGSVTIADYVLGWWQGWSVGEANPEGVPASPLSVMLEAPSGARVLLDGASRDALVEVLRVLHASPR
jgi:hypothetical protein